MLPWLVILGRCLSIWGSEFVDLHKVGFVAAATSSSSSSLVALVGVAARQRCAVLLKGMSKLAVAACTAAQEAFLQESGTRMDELFKAGYFTIVKRALDEAKCFLTRAITDADSYMHMLDLYSADHVTGLKVQELADRLVQVGTTLCQLAVPCFCNNPNCHNVSGASELGMVCGGSCRCSGCKVARYCSRQCQREHWKQHKEPCGILAAVAAGKGAEAQHKATQQHMLRSIRFAEEYTMQLLQDLDKLVD